MEETPATDFPFALERFAFTEAPADTELRTSESSLKKTTNLARFTPFKRVLIQLGQNIPSALGSPRFPKLCLLYLPGLMNFIHGKKQTNKKNQCLHFKLKDETEVNNTFPIPYAKEIPSGAGRNLAPVGFTEGKKKSSSCQRITNPSCHTHKLEDEKVFAT